jgi:hypothetical protein
MIYIIIIFFLNFCVPRVFISSRLSETEREREENYDLLSDLETSCAA